MGWYVENGDVIGGSGSMKNHTLYQQNGLSSFINSNNIDDIEMNGILNNGYVSCGTVFISSHTLS